jgi:hypothetical protein
LHIVRSASRFGRDRFAVVCSAAPRVARASINGGDRVTNGGSDPRADSIDLAFVP